MVVVRAPVLRVGGDHFLDPVQRRLIVAFCAQEPLAYEVLPGNTADRTSRESSETRERRTTPTVANFTTG
jgi:hypothetical protein